jgi:ATP-binding cassette subfamily F protein uup
VHVASWAARFLFTGEQLNQPVRNLSGGERARVLIAKLMLEPADVLLLDEPTNDLDIPTLEILEENLLDFPGALVLVTHDRYLLNRVSSTVLGPRRPRQHRPLRRLRAMGRLARRAGRAGKERPGIE